MVDLHMHTVFSDGKNSIEEMVQKSLELGLKKIAITDHIWRNSDWFDDYYNEITTLRKKYPQIEILVGFEAKALSINGEIDTTEYMCQKVDIRLGAIHRIPKSEKIGEFFERKEISKNKDMVYKNWLFSTENMIKNNNVDVIAHPFMVLDKYNLKVNMVDIYALLNLAKSYNTKLEISSRYKESNKYIIEVLFNKPDYINLISYGSDSHSIIDMEKSHYYKTN